MPYSCMFGAKPIDGNPLLWTLKKEVFQFSEALLSKSSYQHLLQKCIDKPNPAASHVAKVLSTKEDQLLDQFLARLRQTMGNFHISTYMFDGAIIQLQPPQTEDMLLSALAKCNSQSSMKMVTKAWGGTPSSRLSSLALNSVSFPTLLFPRNLDVAR